MNEPEEVSVTRVIDAPAEKIFDVLANPAMHPVIDGSGSVQRALGSAPARLALGSRFGMSMRIGLPYVIRNVVVEFEEGRRIAWRHFGRHRWRYQLEPVGGATQVTETFDWSGGLPGAKQFARRSAEHNRQSMEKTLERLDALVTGGDATS